MKEGLYIEELKILSADSLFNISKIEWWLLKHLDNYNKSKQIHFSKHQYEIDGEVLRLPGDFGCPSSEENFIDVYDSLNALTKLHRNEKYFKQEMAIYKDIKNEPLKVKQWIEKNEKLEIMDYSCFLINYLDYDINDNEYHLRVFFLEDNALKVFVDREDFKHTIGFLEVFNEIYW